MKLFVNIVNLVNGREHLLVLDMNEQLTAVIHFFSESFIPLTLKMSCIQRMYQPVNTLVLKIIRVDCVKFSFQKVYLLKSYIPKHPSERFLIINVSEYF